MYLSVKCNLTGNNFRESFPLDKSKASKNCVGVRKFEPNDFDSEIII